MKIARIKIENYKSIVDQTIDEFTHINMLFGHNNSGKSNILKFIELIFKQKVNATGQTQVDSSRTQVVEILGREVSPFWEGIIENQSYIFRNNNWKTPIKFEIDIVVLKTIFQESMGEFYAALEAKYMNAEKNATISIVGVINGLDYYTSEIKLEKVLLQGREVYTRNPTEAYFPMEEASDEHGLKANGYTILPSILNTFSNSVLLLDNDRYFRPEKENKELDALNHANFKNWFHNLSLNEERFDEYMKIIGDIALYKPTGDSNFNNGEMNSPFQSLSFQFARVEEQIQMMLSNGTLGKRFPLESFGTGIQQILYILAKIAEKRPKILLVEEMELNLSPKYQLELIKHLLVNMIEKTELPLKQLFFTTHSPALAYRSDFQIHNVTINSSGETSASRLGAAREVIADFYPDELKQLIVNQVVKKG